jgi:hypothetical protein
VLGEYTESSSDEKEGDNMGEGNLACAILELLLMVAGTNKSPLGLQLSSCLATSAAGKKKAYDAIELDKSTEIKWRNRE